MMKHLIPIVFCMLLSQLCNAQIADGSLAPNISGVDIEGNSYDLHKILDSGKGVVIEISATWCTPCYFMHKTHFLDLIRQTYGPQGTNELEVLFLEGDGKTDLADLDGTGDYTMGNWTYCTSVPILDNMESAASEYQIAYWGSYFVIDPVTKTTKSFSFYDYPKLKEYLVESGIIDQPQSDASMGYVCDEGPEYICRETNTFIPQIELHNLGKSTLDSVSIDVFVDEKFHSTQNWSGNIPSFNSKSIVLNPISVEDNSKVSVVINQPGDSTLTDNVRSFIVQKSNASTLEKVTVQITTDHVGSDTYWHIVNEEGSIVASGGNSWVGTTHIGIGFGANAPQRPEGTYKNNQTYTQIVDLESATCYDFVITDYYGDGFYYKTGGYSVIDHNGNLLFSGAEFRSIAVHPFFNTTLTDTNDSNKDLNIQLSSNPVNDFLNLSMDLPYASITIFDLQGRKIHQSKWNQEPIDLSHISTGLYILKVSSDTQNWTRRFVKE